MIEFHRAVLSTVYLCLDVKSTMIQVVGHTNPDSDSICSALVAAEWLKAARGYDTVALAQGEPTGESAFILEQAGVAAPAICETVAGQQVWLVDFTDLSQAPKGIEDAEVVGVIDHHRLGDLITANPLEAWIWPVGCCSTILYNLFVMENIEISRANAVLMLGAICSDTVAFRSPTCTEKDVIAAEALAKIAGLDLEAFCEELMLVKTNLNGLSIASLVDRDLKKFPVKDDFVVVGQIEIASFDQVTDKIEALQEELAGRCASGELKLAALMVTNISTSVTKLLFQGEWSNMLAEHASETNIVEMENTLSRKKQGWPWLQTVLGA
ncbi:manganese-dependent inorganic pyrophosphatase [Parendozoicomonas haliclonae]|uniref:inorganic diphosphatase n=1 Tax=Parendozoicomonas haliclonae TaxID=1960125 RepID=A0A1X7AMV8_9GAMM|nr:manganese-dependent inorganic pyrophosphatase [Parendozoicomonas haliclonae]SMA49602.1 putative manganese-dependent inorganic pyrophosphatase [Parendozoicomonas haliclonae]